MRYYFDLIDPVWEKVSIYDGASVFLRDYAAITERQKHVLTTHWCLSEVCNGGFQQFFYNGTGVLCPEAVIGFEAIGMPKTAEVVRQAMDRFKAPYPRDRGERQAALSLLIEQAAEVSPDGEDPDPFCDLDGLFYKHTEEENGGHYAAASRFAFPNEAT